MQQAKKEIQTELADLYSQEEIRVFIIYILEDVLNTNYTHLLAEWNLKLNDEQRNHIRFIIKKLKTLEPIQYILGKTLFAGLTFHTRPGALIPRPETEDLVSLILRDRKSKSTHLLDIGTGSGCIAISLAHYLPHSKVVAWDISPTAIQLAQENALLNHTNVLFEQKDVLLETSIKGFDVIVSNPPYILEKEKKEMQPTVINYEPSLALFVPDNDPLLFYRHIAKIVLPKLQLNGCLYFEINQKFGKEITELLYNIGFKNVTLIRDSFENPRIIKASK